LSFDIAKVSIALGSSEIEFSSPTVEVEVSGGRGDKTPPATKGGGGK